MTKTLEHINDVVDALTRDYDRLSSADRPSGRGLPRSMSRILIGPEANVTIGMHSKPASHSDYQRWTEQLERRRLKPLWLVTGSVLHGGDLWCGIISETEAVLSNGHQICDLDDLLYSAAVGQPQLITIEDKEPEVASQPPVVAPLVVAPMIPAAGFLDDPMPDYNPATFLDAETGELLEHPWCPICQQPRSRAERSTHVIREALAEPEGVVIDAGLLIEIDTELGTDVFTSETAMTAVLDRFVDYGWGSEDRDGDILRTDVTASEPIVEELREVTRGSITH